MERCQLALAIEVAFQMGNVGMVSVISLHFIQNFQEDSEDRFPA